MTPPPSLHEAFARGNYAAVALRGDPQDWRTYASLGLIGLADPALEGLRRFDHAQARFYEAVTCWIDGQDDPAARLLEPLSEPHACNLLALLRERKIRVLAQLCSSRQGPEDLLTGMASDPRFEVSNISFHPADRTNRARASMADFYVAAQPPHFYLCQMLEMHVLHPDLARLPCPIIGQSADYDMHLQTLYPWLRLFDEIIVIGSNEWPNLADLVEVPVSTFSKCYGLNDVLPKLVRNRRTMDVMSSGTVLHPYRPEKAELYHQLQQAADISSFHVNGFVEDYPDLLSRTRAAISWVPSSGGGISTKALQALAHGCCLMNERGSALALFVKEGQGVLSYDAAGADLVTGLRTLLADWDAMNDRAQAAAARVRQDFALTRLGPQYLRFATFLAARPRSQRAPAVMPGLPQKRLTFLKGWRLPDDALRELTAANVREGRDCLARDADLQTALDLARETTLWLADHVSTGRVPPAGMIAETLGLYRWAQERFPESLVLAFNGMRAALHLGAPADVSAATATARSLLSEDCPVRQVEALHNVLPWDLFNAFFNYRHYIDLVQSHLRREGDRRPQMRDCILASVCYYLSHYDSDISLLRRAVHPDSAFP